MENQILYPSYKSFCYHCGRKDQETVEIEIDDFDLGAVNFCLNCLDKIHKFTSDHMNHENSGQ
jgi:hypothetical protein